MTTTEIINSALELSAKERNEIIHRILDSLNIKTLSNAKSMARYAEMYDVMCSLLGEETLPVKCRKAEYVRARQVIAYAMRMEGYTYMQIGNAVGLDHSSITHLCNNMETALSLPKMYKDDVRLYDAFRERLRDKGE